MLITMVHICCKLSHPKYVQTSYMWQFFTRATWFLKMMCSYVLILIQMNINIIITWLDFLASTFVQMTAVIPHKIKYPRRKWTKQQIDLRWKGSSWLSEHIHVFMYFVIKIKMDESNCQNFSCTYHYGMLYLRFLIETCKILSE